MRNFLSILVQAKPITMLPHNFIKIYKRKQPNQFQDQCAYYACKSAFSTGSVERLFIKKYNSALTLILRNNAISIAHKQL